MRLSSTQKLTFAALFTLASLLATAWLAYAEFGMDAYSNRLATVWSLQHDATPVWSEIDDVFKRAVPPDAMPLPHGDPDAALTSLLRYPIVDKAFFVDRNGFLTVKQRQGRRTESYRVDLRRWRPTTLNLSPERFRHGRRLLREWFVQYLLDYQRYDWNSETRRFLPIRPDTIEYVLFSKGDRQDGYLGYDLDTEWFEKHDGAPLLARYGIAADLHWTFVNWGEASLPPAKPLDDALRFVRLQVASPPYDAYNLRVLYTFFALLIVGLIACVLGISACIRQGRVVLNEQAIALAQSNFVSAVSHEMRTPLTTIKLYAEMLQQGVVESPEKRADYLQTITRECDRLTRLIENVLDFARVSQRRRDYHFEEVDLEALLNEAIATLRGPLEQAGTTVELTVPAGLKASVDRDALVNAVANLLSNAVKYAPNQPRIALSAREAGQTVVISVRDFGPGIPSHEQRRIFRSFYRVGDEHTRSTQGTGLGLALVQEYVSAHGGKVELESRPGEGATFRLVLPRLRKSA